MGKAEPFSILAPSFVFALVKDLAVSLHQTQRPFHPLLHATHSAINLSPFSHRAATLTPAATAAQTASRAPEAAAAAA